MLHSTYSHRESENTCPHCGNKDMNSSCRSAASVEIIPNAVATNLLFRGICFPGKCTWTCSKRTSWSRNSNTVKSEHHLWKSRIIKTEQTELDTLMYPSLEKKSLKWQWKQGRWLFHNQKKLFSSAFSFSKEARIARLFAVRCSADPLMQLTSILSLNKGAFICYELVASIIKIFNFYNERLFTVFHIFTIQRKALARKFQLPCLELPGTPH